MHILISDLKLQTMKFINISNLLIYIALFRCMDLCGCFWLERGLTDRAAFWSGRDCKYLRNSSVCDTGCRCDSTQKVNILANENGSHIKCEGKSEIVTLKISGKKTCLLYHSNQDLTVRKKLQVYFHHCVNYLRLVESYEVQKFILGRKILGVAMIWFYSSQLKLQAMRQKVLRNTVYCISLILDFILFSEKT